MSEHLCVKWTITANEYPQPLLHCRRCCSVKPYRTGGRIRANANGKRIDAWLIYRCTACDSTWNRPILERRSVHSLDPGFLSSLCANDPVLVDRIASDVDDLKRWAPRPQEAGEVVVSRQVLSETAGEPSRVRIVCAVPRPVRVRLDRLLADELKLSRSRVQALADSGILVVEGGKRALRKPMCDGTEVQISLPVPDDDQIAWLAAGEGTHAPS